MDAKTMRTGKAIIGAVAATLLASSAQAALVISTDATQNVTCSSDVCTATAADAVLNTTDLANLIASAPVTIQSGNEAQDIVFNAPFSWTSSNGLTLDAYHSIIVAEPVSDAGDGTLTLKTKDGDKTGKLLFRTGGNIGFLGMTNILKINRKTYTLVNSIAALASDIAAKPNGYYALAASYDASVDGTYTSVPIPTQFQGHFEGLGNSISNLTVDAQTGNGQAGLFGYIAGAGKGHEAAELSNLVLTNVKINDAGIFGLRAGILAGSIGFAQLFNINVAGSISAGDRSYIGGLVGESATAVIELCSANVSLSAGKKSMLGGLAGTNESLQSGKATIMTSYATGLVQGGGSSDVGGLVGLNFGLVSNSYSTASVVGGSFSNVGGMIGMEPPGEKSYVRYAYDSGAVLGDKGSSIGGFVGYDTTFGSITVSYWDTTTTGLDHGAGNIEEYGMTGLTDDQLKSGLPAGFSGKIWAEDPNINNGYPYLIDNPPPE